MVSVCQLSPARMRLDEDDLADVVAAVGERAADRQRHGELFAADGDGGGNVAGLERIERIGEAAPARVPIVDQFCA